MKFYHILWIIIFSSCASSSTRKLSQQEISQLGITGMAYDLRLCPTIYDAKINATRENGPCELIDCYEKKGKIECKARPEPKLP